MKLSRPSTTSVFGTLVAVLVASTYLLYLYHGQPEQEGSLGQAMEAAQDDSPLPGPLPELSPQAAVETVLTALQANDQPHADAGIETAFRFASPANRMHTGPLNRFRELVRSPVFLPMIGHGGATVIGAEQRGDQALVLVTLAQPDGNTASYEFFLSRQYMEPYVGCWMTDGVRRVEEPPAEETPLEPPAKAQI